MSETGGSRNMFALGRIVATSGALHAVDEQRIDTYLELHANGDWGCISPDDKELNDEAVKYGSRLLSAYPIDPAKPCQAYGCNNTLWIITEADRSATTVLLPDEY